MPFLPAIFGFPCTVSDINPATHKDIAVFDSGIFSEQICLKCGQTVFVLHCEVDITSCGQ